jgi:hypothetical protein
LRPLSGEWLGRHDADHLGNASAADGAIVEGEVSGGEGWAHEQGASAGGKSSGDEEPGPEGAAIVEAGESTEAGTKGEGEEEEAGRRVKPVGIELQYQQAGYGACQQRHGNVDRTHDRIESANNTGM